MAASLVRACIQFRQPLIDIIRRDQTTNYVFQNVVVTCLQCQCYHVAPVYLRAKNYEAQREKQIKKGIVPLVKSSVNKNLPVIEVWRNMTVQELANSAQRSLNDVLDAISIADPEGRYGKSTVIFDNGVTIKAVRSLGGKVQDVTNLRKPVEKTEKNEDVARRPPPDESVLKKRRPIVTVMGHVDHGKTTLLDALRDTSVVETEFGGITQHIGAFNVTLKSGEKVTFLDTPGHAAFSAMRSRGAYVTDIVVLVVAADDGVMEQTVQSIEMAKNANVPIIVAINKIDKHEADIERTHNMLAQQGIVVEELGGDVQAVNISALKRTNLDTLTEAIVLQSELMGLKGDPTGMVEGVLIECTNHIGRGKLATALIQRGTLKKGSVLVSGLTWAKVRAMFDHAGNPVKEAKLSDAVQIIGWRGLPNVGDDIIEVENEKKATKVVSFREMQEGEILAREHKTAADKKHEQHLLVYKKELETKRMTNKYKKVRRPQIVQVDPLAHIPKVNVIVKADVSGSVEAILNIIDSYTEDDKCRLNVVHYGVGDVTENDLELAEAFDAIIYRFHVGMLPKIKDLADEKNVSIRPHKVIYKLVDDIKDEINSKLPSVEAEEVIGEAAVLQEFEINEGKKKVKVAGCRCVKGVLKKNGLYHLIRNQNTIYTGKLISLRHLKDEVTTVKVDFECGLRLDDPTVSFQPGDTLICFRMYQKSQKSDWDPGF